MDTTNLTCDIVVAGQWIRHKERVADPPGVIFFKAVHDEPVSQLVGNISVSIVARRSDVYCDVGDECSFVGVFGLVLVPEDLFVRSQVKNVQSDWANLKEKFLF